MEAVSARNMELYQNMRPVWESHGVVWYQPNRQNWVIPAIMNQVMCGNKSLEVDQFYTVKTKIIATKKLSK